MIFFWFISLIDDFTKTNEKKNFLDRKISDVLSPQYLNYMTEILKGKMKNSIYYVFILAKIYNKVSHVGVQ